MTELWALSASAHEVDAAKRDELAREVEMWLNEGHAAVSLATCHRVELYGLGPAPQLAMPLRRDGVEAVSHLFRVASGLESAIVGEDEVLHQVREALLDARMKRRLDFRLQRLFESAIATGRRARSRRTESSGNLAQKAVAWLGSKSRMTDRMVIVAGAGRMGAALAHSLADAGALVTIASRDPVRATRLARIYNGDGVSLVDGAQLARRAAGVAVALGGTWSDLAAVEAFGLPPIADISAPQAVPDSVRRGLNGSFLGIDDLYQRSGVIPGAYIKDAQALVDRYAKEYMAWFGSRR